jgi:hypothetical protein
MDETAVQAKPEFAWNKPKVFASTFAALRIDERSYRNGFSIARLNLGL